MKAAIIAFDYHGDEGMLENDENRAFFVQWLRDFADDIEAKRPTRRGKAVKLTDPPTFDDKPFTIVEVSVEVGPK